MFWYHSIWLTSKTTHNDGGIQLWFWYHSIWLTSKTHGYALDELTCFGTTQFGSPLKQRSRTYSRTIRFGTTQFGSPLKHEKALDIQAVGFGTTQFGSPLKQRRERKNCKTRFWYHSIWLTSKTRVLGYTRACMFWYHSIWLTSKTSNLRKKSVSEPVLPKLCANEWVFILSPQTGPCQQTTSFHYQNAYHIYCFPKKQILFR